MRVFLDFVIVEAVIEAEAEAVKTIPLLATPMAPIVCVVGLGVFLHIATAEDPALVEPPWVMVAVDKLQGVEVGVEEGQALDDRTTVVWHDYGEQRENLLWACLVQEQILSHILNFESLS